MNAASTRAGSATGAWSRSSTRFRYRVFMAYLDLDELPEAFVGPACCGPRRTRRPCASAARTTSAIPTSRWPTPSGARRRAHRHAPGRPGTAADQPALPGPPVQPGELLLLLRPRRRGAEAVVAEVTNTPWGERHAYVLGVRGADGAVRGRVDKVFHVSPFMAMDHEYELCLTPAGRALSVRDRQPQGRRGALRREPRARTRRRSTPPACGASCAASRRRRSPSWRASTPTPLRLKLKGAPYFGHPREAPR